MFRSDPPRATSSLARSPVATAHRIACWAGAISFLLMLSACRFASTEPAVPADSVAAPTFPQVAEVLYRACADCHRPGGSAPFSLLTFEETAPRARAMADAVARGYMPPWLPVGAADEAPDVFAENEPRDFPAGYAGERRLEPREVRMLRLWAEAGAPRGVGPAPSPPPSTPGWGLGAPDLVVEFAEFTVPARGRDIYRNLVLPAPVSQGRWIRTAEVRPGAPHVVHHARMMIDTTASSRTLDQVATGVGFDGMDGLGVADDPPGFFIGWTPGKGPSPGRTDLAWRLEPGTDLVLQLHLRPNGRERPVRAKVGLYFADEPPRRESVRLVLRSEDIDIAPGDSAFVVEQRYRLPVPVEVLGVYPHAHYLGKRLHGWATLPDGRRRWLIRIDDWDFDWQDEYRFREPPLLPAGTEVTMRFTYDNSQANPRNPFDPPRRVVFGAESSDEMAELAIQFLPRKAGDVVTLQQDIARWRYLAWSREEAASHRARGDALAEAGALEEAADAYRRSLLEENDPAVMVELGRIVLRQGQAEAAVLVLRQAVAAMDAHEARSLVLLAEALAATGDREGARATLDQAEARLESEGAGTSELRDRIRALRTRFPEGGGPGNPRS